MKNLILLFLCMFLVIGCGRNSDDKNASPQDVLPVATQTGANTAGCNVNGTLLIPKNGDQSIGGQPLYGLRAYPLNLGYTFYIENYKTGDYLFVYIPDVSRGSGNYTINQSNGIDTPAGNQDQNQMYLKFGGKTYLSSVSCGNLVVSKYSYPITSGTFSATLYNKDYPTEKIQITDGRFDINTLTLNK